MNIGLSKRKLGDPGTLMWFWPTFGDPITRSEALLQDRGPRELNCCTPWMQNKERRWQF